MVTLPIILRVKYHREFLILPNCPIFFKVSPQDIYAEDEEVFRKKGQQQTQQQDIRQRRYQQQQEQPRYQQQQEEQPRYRQQQEQQPRYRESEDQSRRRFVDLEKQAVS